MMIIILFNSINSIADNLGKFHKSSGTSSAAMYDANRVIKDEEKQGLPSAR